MQAKMVGSIWVGGDIEENNLMNREVMKSTCAQTMHPYNPHLRIHKMHVLS